MAPLDYGAARELAELRAEADRQRRRADRERERADRGWETATVAWDHAEAVPPGIDPLAAAAWDAAFPPRRDPGAPPG